MKINFIKKLLFPLEITKNVSFLLICLFALSSCAKYTPKPLHQAAGSRTVKNDIAVSANMLSDDECFYYFSRHAGNKGYQPLLLTINNDTNDVLVLKGSDINLNMEKTEIVAKQLHLNTTKRVLTWGIFALFIWPFIIPAACDGLNSSSANKKLDKDFSDRVIDQSSQLVIKPYSSVNKVIFLTPSNYRSIFELCLENQTNDESISFRVRLS